MTIKGSCHCKATAFEVSAAPENVTRCTCSFCSKRGALWAYYTPSQFTLTTPEANVSTYRWGSKTIKHHFCAVCGCGTFTETPDWSTGKPDFDNPKISVNARLLRRLRSRRGRGGGHRRQESLVESSFPGDRRTVICDLPSAPLGGWLLPLRRSAFCRISWYKGDGKG